MKEPSARLEKKLAEVMPEVMEGLSRCWRCPIGANTEKGLNLAGQKAVCEVLDSFISMLFPGCHGMGPVAERELKKPFEDMLHDTTVILKDQIRRVLEFQCTKEKCDDCGKCAEKADDIVAGLVSKLPSIQGLLQKDILAAYEGDPAASSTVEVVMSYPGVYAIIVHRIAHTLYQSAVPMIPRIMAEHAHSRTGIDIHPGAVIGEGFFIDHGTGVVIGETCEIGRNVKLYQGVTLGALSFEKDDQGKLIKGGKRHPTVNDGVVIYAQATILGGNTVIGEGSEIGGNVWLTHSVPPGSKVYNQQPRPLIRHNIMSGHGRAGWNDYGLGI